MSTEQSQKPDLLTGGDIIQAASDRGGLSGNDAEIEDLQAYILAAFDLLSKAQKQQFFANEDVQTRLKASGVGVDDDASPGP